MRWCYALCSVMKVVVLVVRLVYTPCLHGVIIEVRSSSSSSSSASLYSKRL